MKPLLRLKGLAAVALVAVTPLLTNAQQALDLIGGSRFQVVSPASIQGLKNNTNSFASGWGGSLATPLVNVPVVRALGTGNGGTDSLMCTPAASTTAFFGKAALLFRGDCNFSLKAYEAQLGGAVAVIIVNNIPGPPVGMAAGTNGTQVTIPVVMVTDVDGKAMNSAIRNGQAVNVSFAQWSLGLATDYSIVQNTSAPFHASLIPAKQLMGTNTAAAYRVYTGSVIANYGTADLTGAYVRKTVTFTPTGGAATQLYSDTTTVGTITPADSIDFNVSPRYFNPVVSGKGVMTSRSSVLATQTDIDTGDNFETTTVTLTDSIYSKGAYDFTTNAPVASTAYRRNDNTVLSWGPLFYTAKGGDAVKKIQFACSKGTDTLLGQFIFLPVFKWTDGANGAPADGIFQPGELTLKGLGSYTYPGGVRGFDVVTVDYGTSNPNAPLTDLNLEDNSWYWYPVNPTDPTVFIATDNRTNPYTRYYASRLAAPEFKTEYSSPTFNGIYSDANSGVGTFSMFPFFTTDSVERIAINQKAYTTAVAVHVGKAYTAGVKSAANNVSSFESFPNPASADLNLKWTVVPGSKKIGIVVYNAYGQPVITRTTTDVTGSMSLPTSTLPAGNYWVILATEGGSQTRTITLTR